MRSYKRKTIFAKSNLGHMLLVRSTAQGKETGVRRKVKKSEKESRAGRKTIGRDGCLPRINHLPKGSGSWRISGKGEEGHGKESVKGVHESKVLKKGSRRKNAELDVLKKRSRGELSEW